MKKVKDEIKDHPLLYIFLAVISAGIAVFGSTTMATNNYVDKGDSLSREYTKEKTGDLKKELSEIKTAIRDNHKLIIKLIEK